MAHHQNNPPSFLNNLGQKVQTGLKLASTAKGIFDAGRMVVQGLQVAAPYIAALL
jgi:hypothetical protein